MLYREIIVVCSQIHTKHINNLYGQKVDFLYVKPVGTYSDHCAVKGHLLVRPLHIDCVCYLRYIEKEHKNGQWCTE